MQRRRTLTSIWDDLLPQSRFQAHFLHLTLARTAWLFSTGSGLGNSAPGSRGCLAGDWTSFPFALESRARTPTTLGLFAIRNMFLFITFDFADATCSATCSGMSASWSCVLDCCRASRTGQSSNHRNDWPKWNGCTSLRSRLSLPAHVCINLPTADRRPHIQYFLVAIASVWTGLFRDNDGGDTRSEPGMTW